MELFRLASLYIVYRESEWV